MAWVRKLHARFAAIWPGQFAARSSEENSAQYQLVCSEWLATLQKVRDEGVIGRAIDWCRENLDHPPTHKQFLEACRRFEPARGHDDEDPISWVEARAIQARRGSLRLAVEQLQLERKHDQ